MLTIRTKYLGPGNIRGSRVAVWRETSYVPEGRDRRHKYFGWNDGLDPDANHRGAAMAWLRENNPEMAESIDDGLAMLVPGDVGNGYVFVVLWLRDVPSMQDA